MTSATRSPDDRSPDDPRRDDTQQQTAGAERSATAPEDDPVRLRVVPDISAAGVTARRPAVAPVPSPASVRATLDAELAAIDTKFPGEWPPPPALPAHWPPPADDKTARARGITDMPIELYTSEFEAGMRDRYGRSWAMQPTPEVTAAATRYAYFVTALERAAGLEPSLDLAPTNGIPGRWATVTAGGALTAVTTPVTAPAAAPVHPLHAGIEQALAAVDRRHADTPWPPAPDLGPDWPPPRPAAAADVNGWDAYCSALYAPGNDYAETFLAEMARRHGDGWNVANPSPPDVHAEMARFLAFREVLSTVERGELAAECRDGLDRLDRAATELATVGENLDALYEIEGRVDELAGRLARLTATDEANHQVPTAAPARGGRPA